MAITLPQQDLNMDELSMGLLEVNKTSQEPGEGVQRYQIIRVIRLGPTGKYEPHNFERKMGKAESFTTDQFWVTGGVMTLTNGEVVAIPAQIPYSLIKHYEPLHRVGKLLDIAEERHNAPTMEDMLDLRPRNYIDEYINSLEDRLKIRARRSTFGPMFVRQFSDTGLDR